MYLSAYRHAHGSVSRLCIYTSLMFIKFETILTEIHNLFCHFIFKLLTFLPTPVLYR